jgi:hypothetical protein
MQYIFWVVHKLFIRWVVSEKFDEIEFQLNVKHSLYLTQFDQPTIPNLFDIQSVASELKHTRSQGRLDLHIMRSY